MGNECNALQKEARKLTGANSIRGFDDKWRRRYGFGALHVVLRLESIKLVRHCIQGGLLLLKGQLGGDRDGYGTFVNGDLLLNRICECVHSCISMLPRQFYHFIILSFGSNSPLLIAYLYYATKTGMYNLRRFAR